MSSPNGPVPLNSEMAPSALNSLQQCNHTTCFTSASQSNSLQQCNHTTCFTSASHHNSLQQCNHTTCFTSASQSHLQLRHCVRKDGGREQPKRTCAPEPHSVNSTSATIHSCISDINISHIKRAPRPHLQLRHRVREVLRCEQSKRTRTPEQRDSTRCQPRIIRSPPSCSRC